MTDDKPAEPTRKEQQEWLRAVCVEIGVDPDLLDVGLVLDVTKEVAHRFVRPMAPVSSYALGIAVGLAAASGGPVDQKAIADRIVDTLPPASD
ncbi:DUF6457 domain-containing protein [Yimella sp. NH-Cas1]|uniref:DUF6457 domain-containing protein n=1 Tax=Yimella sp. NH-Cas1 TaxID=2917726 RepID=UPI001EFB56DB|nr:DUF6457 domain-containing protein [Yimella sp. NH-Cas1]MCG8655735.1 DUF6457 domain-containing protein [Yimella sp. NH-Cas1]